MYNITMPIWYGMGEPDKPSIFFDRLEKMSVPQRRLAELQFTQLIVVRVFRMVYSKLSPNQRKQFKLLTTSNCTQQEIIDLFGQAIPDIKNVIHEAVQSVYRDLET